MSLHPLSVVRAAEGLLLACQALLHVPGLPTLHAANLREHALGVVQGLADSVDVLEWHALACDDAARLCGTVLGFTPPVREALFAAQALKDQLARTRGGPRWTHQPPPTLDAIPTCRHETTLRA